jgi:hypothetical protein
MRTFTNWLRAIADCGVLRVNFDSDELVDAWELGLIDATLSPAMTMRLTDAGRRAVAGQVR